VQAQLDCPLQPHPSVARLHHHRTQDGLASGRQRRGRQPTWRPAGRPPPPGGRQRPVAPDLGRLGLPEPLLQQRMHRAHDSQAAVEVVSVPDECGRSHLRGANAATREPPQVPAGLGVGELDRPGELREVVGVGVDQAGDRTGPPEPAWFRVHLSTASTATTRSSARVRTPTCRSPHRSCARASGSPRRLTRRCAARRRSPEDRPPRRSGRRAGPVNLVRPGAGMAVGNTSRVRCSGEARADWCVQFWQSPFW
jgi:hypothetical protein